MRPRIPRPRTAAASTREPSRRKRVVGIISSTRERSPITARSRLHDRDNHCEALMGSPQTQRRLGLLAPALVTVIAGVHFQQYVDFMSQVPTVGFLFLLNAAGGAGIAEQLLRLRGAEPALPNRAGDRRRGARPARAGTPARAIAGGGRAGRLLAPTVSLEDRSGRVVAGDAADAATPARAGTAQPDVRQLGLHTPPADLIV